MARPQVAARAHLRRRPASARLEVRLGVGSGAGRPEQAREAAGKDGRKGPALEPPPGTLAEARAAA